MAGAWALAQSVVPSVVESFNKWGETTSAVGDRLWSEYGEPFAKTALGMYAGHEVGRFVSNAGMHGGVAWNWPGNSAFYRSLGRRAGSAVSRMVNFRARKPFVPQKRFPRHFVRQSFSGDRFRSGSRAVFYERRGDWKKQFLKGNKLSRF